jgi:hypothetical protein
VTRQPKSRKPRLPDPDEMVAIASGTTACVDRWVSVLSGAAIPSAVARCCESDPRAPDFAELWVGRDDADEARKALRLNW